MCKFCHQLSDTVESLENTPCPKRLEFTEESGKTEKCETPLPVTKTPSQIASNVISEMEKANKELKRLQLLKAMAEERDRLAALIARKNKSCFLFAKIEIPVLLLQVQLAIHAWLVYETSSTPPKSNDAWYHYIQCPRISIRITVLNTNPYQHRSWTRLRPRCHRYFADVRGGDPTHSGSWGS